MQEIVLFSAAQATRESHKAKRSKSAARATVPKTDSRQPASEHPSQLVTVPTQPLPPVDIAGIYLRSRARRTSSRRHTSSSSEGARWCERHSGCCCTGVSTGRNSGPYR